MDKIYVSGARQVPTKQIIQMAGIVPGNNIFLVNEKTCTRAVEVHPLIKHAALIRHLPRQVEIKVDERKIWALVPFKDALLCIDNEGICIDKSLAFSLANYPVITYSRMPAEIGLGQAVNPDETQMISKLWSKLSPAVKQNISEFHYNNSTKELLIYTVSGTEIRWGDKSREDEKLSHLTQVVTKLEKTIANQGKDSLEYVDIRFEGEPVLKTRASEANN
ncbi:cell division protein FtsQ/DivIB [Syntrophomonas palmitatica]|uniref:cell division protein FtsQ/DivIB n=1 Tax=Syntrophomonas palmitatica TaxID=402877 RepID=UPI000A45A90E|nr:FtsQ-type POTRA domain-containing protein [Syntrophomonas palmitatica]